jgi:hypothetical protein
VSSVYFQGRRAKPLTGLIRLVFKKKNHLPHLPFIPNPLSRSGESFTGRTPHPEKSIQKQLYIVHEGTKRNFKLPNVIFVFVRQVCVAFYAPRQPA